VSALTLEALQARLDRDLDATGRIEDPQLVTRVREDGRRLVFLLQGLARASRLHAANNEALEPPAAQLAEVLAGLIEQVGAVQVVLAERQAYVNDVRLRPRPFERAASDRLAEELARHELGGVTFHGTLDAAGFKRLARGLAMPAGGPRPAAALRAQLAELRSVELVEPWRFAVDPAPSRGQGRGELLGRIARDAHDTLKRLDAGWTSNPVRLRRAVIDLVDDLAAHPEHATRAPFAGNGTLSERHLVSVCQLSLLLGSALGLPDTSLADLGVAALLHDVGYLTNRHPERHAQAGARLLLRQRGPSGVRTRRLLAVLEHTTDFQRDAEDAVPPSLFARILRVAEHYDLLVAGEAAARRLSPASALERMWADQGRRYDPVLLALFVRALGSRPPGTVLELRDGRWAVVVRPGRDRERWALPVVREMRSAAGAVVADGEEIDLGDERASVTARRVIEPAELDSSLAETCVRLLSAAA
jgi:hypothetical protein